MDKQRDILQIRKYLNGELNAKAMHQLEREAQHDPFLMDALEGYEQAGADQRRNLDLLSERLNERIGKKEERRIIPMWMLAAAAGVVGFLIVVGLLYKQNNTVKPPLTAQEIPAKPPVERSAPIVNADTTPVKLDGPTRPDKNVAHADGQTAPSLGVRNSDIGTPGVAEVQTDTIKPVNTITANEEVSKKLPTANKPVTDELAKNKSVVIDTNGNSLTVAVTKKPLSQPLNGKVEGVGIKEREGKKEYNNSFYLGTLTPPPAKEIMKGVAAGKPAYEPSAAAAANITSGQAAPNTGLTNNTKLNKADAANPAYGYNNPGGKSNPGNADSTTLNRTNDDKAQSNTITNVSSGYFNTTSAHPKNGWADFNAYASQQVKMPLTAKTGTVILKFAVSGKGVISDIKVAQSVSPDADKKAISILRNGPKWVGNTNGRSETVTLEVKFEHAE